APLDRGAGLIRDDVPGAFAAPPGRDPRPAGRPRRGGEALPPFHRALAERGPGAAATCGRSEEAVGGTELITSDHLIPSAARDLLSRDEVSLPLPFTVHRSPFTIHVHRSPFTALRLTPSLPAA